MKVYFTFGLQIRIPLIPIKAPEKHPVTADYKEVKKMEELRRHFHW